MRKVLVGAVQPAEITTSSIYRWDDSSYNPDPDAIIENCILPQAEVTFGLLEQAGEAGVDIVTTSEDISGTNSYLLDTSKNNVFPELVTRTTHIFEERLSDIAKKYNMNIAANYFKKYGDKVYNVSPIFDRKGELVGEQRKIHLPCNESLQVIGGDEIKVFDLDIGTVGVLICYDIMFPAMGEVLSLLGAEIVFHPTNGYGWYESIGEATLRTRASDGSYYLVTAKDYRYNAPGKSSVIDYWGHVMVDAGYQPDVIVTAQLDLDIAKAQPDWFIQSGLSGQPDMRLRHDSERRPELYGKLCKPPANRYKVPSLTEQERFREKFKNNIYRW
ncbi:MAG: carbon-nitrogen hydrolase family protein [Oscillospiraceae bacterium]|jgi:N-carbamoylputrescine amidase|nr:carbon-nitrogen hydrolase family protein [Oscillospiraceae bacterium]